MVSRVAKVEISKFTLYDMLILIRSPNLRAIFMLIEDNISIIGNHTHSSPIWETIILETLRIVQAEPSQV